jgi:hypothetical protein
MQGEMNYVNEECTVNGKFKWGHKNCWPEGTYSLVALSLSLSLLF